MNPTPPYLARCLQGDEKMDSVNDNQEIRAIEEVVNDKTDNYGLALAATNAAAESRIRVKMDWCLMPLVSLIYLLAFIDRSNIGNAKLAGLERDLNMKGYDYNTALSIFYISYIVFEIPLNALCKRIGPGWFLPATSMAFGICTICTAFVQNFSSLCGLRFLLGIFEAAMMPGIVYFLSRWYRRSELTFRIALFIISAALAGAFGGLLASAILRLPSFGSLHSWRMIFAIEGIATCVLSIISFLALPDRPETAAWLSREEKELAIARLKAERIGTTDLIDTSSWNKLKLGIINPVVLPTSLIFLLNSITVHGISFFLPTIVRTIYPNRSVQTQQLLTVPPYVVGAAACVAISFCSWKLDRRGIFLIFCCPLTVVGYAILLASSEPTVRYGATFLPFVGIFSYGSLTNSHVSANVVSDTARSSAIATNGMMGNIGGLISTWAFLESDAPRFSIGNGLNLAAQASMFFIAIALYFWIERDNKKKKTQDVAAELDGKHSQDIEEMDWKHPGFLWHN
ncbi:major facilitator superfamily protein [Hirsutella rhossiliensis]|uniref:Major facilitator superfamily domain-containing protein n=1 Tax=Hirsutella rhossiliensis TaxID=111463 RepID=A0A9P8SN25_9HYPO|nr:major facilitator superfamily domain-containing protein [Hirsutella rhossiliensis]KAH0967924.1 major facilitator superfamily domain-containing protein [Hirsutella rhossiliensis]